ncbi:hypothetical protein MGG_15322 [Pyricularia oryzae 70-15]|uniref:Uncharacterized protein n=2 Tax=Pyricularia oryzae TaxID=318829 RepID=G4MVB7_PYRO7|nr:uncharacterized protein MGG_15322 [Pyricularia oryzae 70-15]EHA54939.1 hypothetical protein MGG_15322 [Pyricularia oryzae 70-15]ELQ41165.1 hypothetical protein OOU_Y34scaffold00295g3 [Pyricularia oryzae Y34]
MNSRFVGLVKTLDHKGSFSDNSARRSSLLPDSSAAGVNDTRLGNIFCHFEANLDKAMQINADALIPSTKLLNNSRGFACFPTLYARYLVPKEPTQRHRRGREVDGPKSIHMRDGSLRFPVDLLSQLGHQSDKTRAGWCDGGQGVQVIDCIVIFGRPMRWCYKPSGATCWIDHASITAAAVTTRLATHNTNRFTVLRERSFRAWVAGDCGGFEAGAILQSAHTTWAPVTQGSCVRYSKVSVAMPSSQLSRQPPGTDVFSG